MEIYVLDSSFSRINVIDTYESFIWTDRLNECGDFELYSSVNSTLLSKLSIGSLKKYRYELTNNMIIDFLLEKHAGKVYCEIEFESEQQALEFVPEKWMTLEVTENKCHKSKNLIFSC